MQPEREVALFFVSAATARGLPAGKAGGTVCNAQPLMRLRLAKPSRAMRLKERREARVLLAAMAPGEVPPAPLLAAVSASEARRPW